MGKKQEARRHCFVRTADLFSRPGIVKGAKYKHVRLQFMQHAWIRCKMRHILNRTPEVRTAVGTKI
jgi:hypothetical protein